MKPKKDPLWNKEYIEQRLRERRVNAELKRIAEATQEANDADYWFTAFMEANNRCTELETENAKLRLMLKDLYMALPAQRTTTTTVTEIW